MNATVRYLRQYLRPQVGAVQSAETVYRRQDAELAATVYRPSRTRLPLPGWVVLHGLTYRGREHASLVRFARAVAASGGAVFVPDIPEWRALRVAPDVTVDTIRSAVFALDERADVASGRVGVIGFSFGATQALVAATDARLAGRLRAIVSWGGYCDLHRLFRFGITGEHELDGARYRTDPDPYGAWIMGANYITHVPGHERHAELAAALLALASEAGRRGSFAGDPVYDPFKRELRARLPAEQAEIFDLLAPPGGRPPADLDRARLLAAELATTAKTVDPLLDPYPVLPKLRVRTLIAHGRDDRLVPFTEATRLRRALPHEHCRGCTITRLFAHSGGTSAGLGPIGIAREGARMVGLMRSVLGLL